VRHVDPRARALTTAGYIVGLVCVFPAVALTVTQPSVDHTGCGTFLSPTFAGDGLREAEEDLRASGGTTMDAAELHQLAADCDEALRQRRLYVLAVASLGFASAVGVPVIGRRRMAAEP